MVVTKNKTDLYIASQINHEGLFDFLASEFLSELYLYLPHSLFLNQKNIQFSIPPPQKKEKLFCIA
jgi:hypothetical protein